MDRKTEMELRNKATKELDLTIKISEEQQIFLGLGSNKGDRYKNLKKVMKLSQ